MNTFRVMESVTSHIPSSFHPSNPFILLDGHWLHKNKEKNG